MNRIISASLSPNTKADDVLIAWKTLLRPGVWITGNAVQDAEVWFENRYSGYEAFSFNSGRSAEFELLKAFGIGSGDEVLIQAFTCVAVPNSIRWVGAKPVYVDIDETLNISVADAQKKVTKKTRAIIVQHTFGIPADMNAVMSFAKQHGLILIEDCAHSLGATYNGKIVGSFGDASFFSFGRDKVISCVFGGMAIVRSDHKPQISSMKKNYDLLPGSFRFWILQQLLHPIAFSIIIPLYSLGAGKLILYLLQRLKLLSFPVYPKEKKGLQPRDFPAKCSNALAILLMNQLKKLELLNTHRIAIASVYRNVTKTRTFKQGAIYLRYPMLVADPKGVILNARKQGILLGNWYHNVIDPVGVNFQNIGYITGSCPYAEEVAKHVINLPTNISEREARIVISNLP
jgi:perosamine synthetase